MLTFRINLPTYAYNRVKYFFPYLNETTFYAKLSGPFSGSKTKVTLFIASKFGANMRLINLKPGLEVDAD